MSSPNQRSQNRITSLESVDDIVFMNAGGTIISSWTKSPILGAAFDAVPPFHAISGVEPMPHRRIYLGLSGGNHYRARVRAEIGEGEESFDLQAL